jgi:hypothetical protein
MAAALARAAAILSLLPVEPWKIHENPDLTNPKYVLTMKMWISSSKMWISSSNTGIQPTMMIERYKSTISTEHV